MRNAIHNLLATTPAGRRIAELERQVAEDGADLVDLQARVDALLAERTLIRIEAKLDAHIAWLGQWLDRNPVRVTK